MISTYYYQTIGTYITIGRMWLSRWQYTSCCNCMADALPTGGLLVIRPISLAQVSLVSPEHAAFASLVLQVLAGLSNLVTRSQRKPRM